MGNAYQPPKLEKRENTVVKQVKDEAQADRVLGVSSVNVQMSADDIYKKNITDFASFLKGEIAAGTLEERQKFQRTFFNSIPAMLRLSDAQVKAVLDHFLRTIAENRQVFDYSNVLSPLYTIESQLNKVEVERYKRFMLFIILLSDNARDRQRFLANFDMTKFTSMFDPVTKQRLTNYVYR